MPRGWFITLEGLDGSGKTTQINRLAGLYAIACLDTQLKSALAIAAEIKLFL